MLTSFISHTGIIAPMDRSNVDTDAIIPKQFLQKINRTGFSEHLFHNWRFLNGNTKTPDLNFVLNQKHYKSASILISRENFGCGSSREHAVWALLDYGFKSIIAPDFADIFYDNSFNNQLLLITLSKVHIDSIFNIVFKNPGIQATINLKMNFIILKNQKYIIKINDFHRHCLLNGFDSIDLTMKYERYISKYEKNIPVFYQ
ncbi:3-isopropylmalate dehydratase small subunit [Buchnera aphidicola]|uniref:3-isopropylmalate dehydratase small subunit n=1 Tax=Buchnera aphidicola TaxID=9 RepID=UPI003463F831